MPNPLYVYLNLKSNQSDQLVQANVKEFKDKLYGQRNIHNLSMLYDVFLQ